jgi:hypothetical protein
MLKKQTSRVILLKERTPVPAIPPVHSPPPLAISLRRHPTISQDLASDYNYTFALNRTLEREIRFLFFFASSSGGKRKSWEIERESF